MKKLLLVFAHREDEASVAATVETYKTIKWNIDRMYATDLGYDTGALATLTPGTLEDPIYRVMERGLPNIVITFDTTGMNNDPDHRKVCYAATFAFQRYVAWLEALQKKFRIRAVYDEQWLKRLETMIMKGTEPKLYFVCAPESIVTKAVGKGELPRESFGKPWRGVPDKQITTVIGDEHFMLRMEGTKEHFVGKKDRISDKL